MSDGIPGETIFLFDARTGECRTILVGLTGACTLTLDRDLFGWLLLWMFVLDSITLPVMVKASKRGVGLASTSISQSLSVAKEDRPYCW